MRAHGVARLGLAQSMAGLPTMDGDSPSRTGRAPASQVPSLPAQCIICGRWLGRERMCVVAIGADDQCGLCGHLGAVASAVPTSPISATDEEEAMELLMQVYVLLRRARR